MHQLITSSLCGLRLKETTVYMLPNQKPLMRSPPRKNAAEP
jgi:hypothetical protein